MFTSYGQYTITCIYDGSAIWTTTTAPSTPNYTFTISNLSGSSDRAIQVGDIIMYSYYRYDVSEIGSTTVKCATRTSIRGSSGAATYTHIRYSANSDGSSFTDTPSSTTKYIGIYVGTSATAPATASSYAPWVKYIGTDGNNGVSVSSVTPLYYCTSTTTAPVKPTVTVSTNNVGTYGAWNKAIATYTTTNKYYFTCQEILLSNGNRVWSDVARDASLETANANAYSAVQTANTAKDTADDAKEAVETLTQTMSGVESTVNKVDKAITDKVWQTDITSYDQSTVQSIRDRVTKTETDINGITSTVSDTQSYFKDNVNKYTEGLQEGTTDTYAPNVQSLPASAWTASEKEEHVGDVMYTSDGIYLFKHANTGTGDGSATTTYIWKKLDNTEIGDMLVSMQEVKSQVIQQADAITSIVSGESYDGTALVSTINQTAEEIKISAEKISLNGDVYFDSSSENGGVRIVNGAIKAEHMDVNSFNAESGFVDHLTSNIINTDYIESLELKTDKGTIGGFHITDHSIYSNDKSDIYSQSLGIHLDSNGQANIGDGENYVKFSYDNNGSALDIKANNVEIDKDGIRVKANDTDGLHTEITDKSFSGYYMDDEVFRLSKDLTITRRLQVDNGIDFKDTIKEVPVQYQYTVGQTSYSVGVLVDIPSKGSAS